MQSAKWILPRRKEARRGQEFAFFFLFLFLIASSGHREGQGKGRQGATYGWWSGYRREASGKMGVRAYRKGNTYIFLRFRRLISASF